MTEQLQSADLPLAATGGPRLDAGPLGRLWHYVSARMLRGARRRALRQLSNRQLGDAGIDLTDAGRGKAVAAAFNPGLHQGF